jgi:hypothetical protein
MPQAGRMAAARSGSVARVGKVDSVDRPDVEEGVESVDGATLVVEPAIVPVVDDGATESATHAAVSTEIATSKGNFRLTIA